MLKTRKEIEAAIRLEEYWLRRVVEEIVAEKISQGGKKFIALACAPWKNSGVKMNLPEYKKAVQLRKFLFNARQKKKIPAWIFAFQDEKISSLDRRIAERLRADLGKKLWRELKKK